MSNLEQNPFTAPPDPTAFDPVLAGARTEIIPIQDWGQQRLRRTLQVAHEVERAFTQYAGLVDRDTQPGAEQLDLFVSSDHATGTVIRAPHHELLPTRLRMTRIWDAQSNAFVTTLESNPNRSNDDVHPMVRDNNGSKTVLFTSTDRQPLMVDGRWEDGKVIPTKHEDSSDSQMAWRGDFWTKALKESRPKPERFRRAMRQLGRSALGR